MANEGEILQAAGQIFFVKGNDVVPMPMSPSIMVDETNPRAINTEFGMGKRTKDLIEDGYELAVDDGSETSKQIRETVGKSETMRGRSFQVLDVNEGIGKKLLRGVTSLGGKFRGKLPGVLGLLDIMGMKREYEQILDGTHYMSDVLRLPSTAAALADQVYKDGGSVSEIIDIFED